MSIRSLLIQRAVCAAGVLILSITAGIVQAQEKISAQVGQETKLAATKQEPKVTSPPKSGKHRILSESGAFTLFYTPNPDIKTPTADELTYQIGDQKPVTVAISIEPRPASPPSTPPAPIASQNRSDPGPAAGFPPNTYDQSLKAVFLLFALAVVLESSLAVLFNWRPFVENFNARAVRPVISFVVALLVVWNFGLDLMTRLLKVITPESTVEDRSTTGMLVTALMLAGGSAAVNNVLVGLGFRQQRTPETAVPRPPPTQGWVAVCVARRQAVGPVSVFVGPAPAAAGLRPPLVTVLHKPSKRGLRYFLADPGRFPRTGGYAVAAGSVIEVHVVGQDSANATVSDTWGPHTIAGGAIVDLYFTL